MTTKTRWCRRGDTIRTVKPVTCGSYSGQHLHVTCPTPESCAQANEYIAAGRWEVSACVKCGDISECTCDDSA